MGIYLMSDRWRAVYLHRETVRILSAVAAKNRVHASKMLLAGQKLKERLARRGIKL